MLKNRREQEILHLMKAGGFVSVKELCAKLYASESAIRRDLTALEKKGLLRKVYGGAEPISNFRRIPPFPERSHQNADAKRTIAEKAKNLIHDGNILFLDQSSTSYYLAEKIADNATLTVVTNNIEIIGLLSETSLTVISSGGTLSRDNRNCLLGTDARRIFEKTYADIAFFSTKSLSFDGIVSDCSREEVTVREAMLQNCAKRVFLCDSEKLGRRSPYTQTSLAEVDVWVCEKAPEENVEFRVLFPSLEIL